MWNYNYTEDQCLEHAGSKGMRWGYSHGKPNGKRKKSVLDPLAESLEKYMEKEDRIADDYANHFKTSLSGYGYGALEPKNDQEIHMFYKNVYRVMDSIKKKKKEMPIRDVLWQASVITLSELGRNEEANRLLYNRTKDIERKENYAANETYYKMKEKNLDRYDARSGPKKRSQEVVKRSQQAYNQAKEKNLERYDRRNKKRVKSNIDHIMGVASNKARKAIKAGKKFIENLFK